MAAMEAAVARRGWIGKRRGKLPQPMAAIAEALEEVDAFRARRMRFQVGLAMARGELRPCEVLRAAGLPAGWLDVVRDEITLAIHRGREAA